MMSGEVDVGDLDVDVAEGEAELPARGGVHRAAQGPGGGEGGTP